MDYKAGDVVSLKSSPSMKMTVREIDNGQVVCDWFNIEKESGSAYMARADFLPQQLAAVKEEAA